ncbi:MAG TPA: NADH-quinone oxidoreductase subunit A [Cytophagales bacterium]|nr:NADH-quinone oxidoreductase subunit A [Cytophagales bacterium]HAA23332.1 NADH-quinone oxidoreductase subunit A [Cytophagales bacterium]HAP65003.1 NADH-quinone oxidoreductase subunit A [Cytophagales bacterium]
MQLEVSGFGTVLLFLIGAIIFIGFGLLTARLLRPHRPNDEKLTTYECGEEPVRSAWGRFNFRFYVVALVFILFDVEIIFLFPWATILGDTELMMATQGKWGNYAFVEMLLFVGILALGLAYVWANGMLDWIKPTVKKPTVNSPVPSELYQQVNKRYESSSASEQAA